MTKYSITPSSPQTLKINIGRLTLIWETGIRNLWRLTAMSNNKVSVQKRLHSVFNRDHALQHVTVIHHVLKNTAVRRELESDLLEHNNDEYHHEQIPAEAVDTFVQKQIKKTINIPSLRPFLNNVPLSDYRFSCVQWLISLISVSSATTLFDS